MRLSEIFKLLVVSRRKLSKNRDFEKFSNSAGVEALASQEVVEVVNDVARSNNSNQ